MNILDFKKNVYPRTPDTPNQRGAKDNRNILDSKKINIFLNEYSGF